MKRINISSTDHVFPDGRWESMIEYGQSLLPAGTYYIGDPLLMMEQEEFWSLYEETGEFGLTRASVAYPEYPKTRGGTFRYNGYEHAAYKVLVPRSIYYDNAGFRYKNKSSFFACMNIEALRIIPNEIDDLFIRLYELNKNIPCSYSLSSEQIKFGTVYIQDGYRDNVL